MKNKERKPTAIVDVDSTLWNMEVFLYKQVRKFDPDVKHYREWTQWKDCRGKLDTPTFYKIVDYVHEDQQYHPPFKGAKELLEYLSTKYYVIIASHRRESAFDTLSKWLHNYELYHDAINLSFDKSKLFNEFVGLIIDDSPKTIEKAVAKDIPCVSLLYPYNKDSGIPLFNNLEDMLVYLKDNEKEKRG